MAGKLNFVTSVQIKVNFPDDVCSGFLQIMFSDEVFRGKIMTCHVRC